MNLENSINRRSALGLIAKSSLGVAAVGSMANVSKGASDSSPKASRKPMLMKVGCQRGKVNTPNLEFLARHGVFNFDGWWPKTIEGVGWDLDDSLAKRDACEKYGISLDAYHLPLSSAGIDKVSVPNIMLGKSPERDREIEMIQQFLGHQSLESTQIYTHLTGEF